MARILLGHQPVDGGVGRHVGDLARQLSGAGHEPITCGPAPPGTSAGEVRHVELELLRALSPAADARAVARLRQIVGSLRPELVHAHSSKAGAIARLAGATHPRTPVLYTPHGFAFAGFFTSSRERAMYRVAEQALSPLAARIVCVCEAEANLARRVAPARRIRVVHNGVPAPPAELAPDERAGTIARRAPVVATLTQLRPGKGVEILLQAFGQVAVDHPHARLAIWGDGPERSSLMQLAQRLGIAGSVHFHGATGEPLRALAGADVFVLASLAEAFPYVVLEAMSLGRPIVASDVGGVREALGDAGLVVPPGDAAALAGEIGRLLGDPPGAAALGQAAHRRVSARYTLRRMTDEILAVYHEVLGRRAPA